MFSYSELWSVRLSVRTQAFHACKRGSIPLRSTKFMDLMCQLLEAGMKLPNSIGGGSGLDSHCGPPRRMPVTSQDVAGQRLLVTMGNV